MPCEWSTSAESGNNQGTERGVSQRTWNRLNIHFKVSPKKALKLVPRTYPDKEASFSGLTREPKEHLDQPCCGTNNQFSRKLEMELGDLQGPESYPQNPLPLGKAFWRPWAEQGSRRNIVGFGSPGSVSPNKLESLRRLGISSIF